ncbi:PREDICTED: uncharacterized protein LOC103326918 [Prunus mume]|uniref:Uncharacterized protein LOC103326918 n=1 Tax=Prunus mume TaxID=102107 RepID=A0ABM0NNE3_PRUMU|nr:PREDICTED: uncharacterized protein LOC103326918 [Prunus mume]
MKTQLGQIVDALSQREPGKFPSQLVILQRNQEQAKAVITLRSGKVINNGVGNEVTNEFDHVNAGPTQEENEKLNDDPSNVTSSFEALNFHKDEKPYTPPIPFPRRLAKSKQDKSFKEIFDILSKVNVNFPLLDVIKNMPAYGKFFKELNIYKRKYGPNEKVMVSENMSVVLQRKLPPKLKDPGSFSINITIGGCPTQEENEKLNDDPSNVTSSFEALNFHKDEKPYTPPIPFPRRLAKSKQDKSFKEIFDILSKVNVNFPLLDVIKNMPAYGKFFKELNIYKRKYGPNEKVMVSENMSVVLQRKLPPKLKDPGSFSINITWNWRL